MKSALKLVPKSELITEEQIEKTEEFLRSKCDMFSSADFDYYAEVTGKGIEWVRENASYHSELGMYGTCLENALIDGDFDLAEMFY
jgi:hypothetical protein